MSHLNWCLSNTPINYFGIFWFKLARKKQNFAIWIQPEMLEAHSPQCYFWQQCILSTLLQQSILNACAVRCLIEAEPADNALLINY